MPEADGERPRHEVPSALTTDQVTAEMNAEHGIVRIQAQTIRPATPQRIAESLVDRADADDRAGDRVRGRDRDAEAVAAKSVIAPPVSAQKPPTGLSLVIRMPIVRTMRQPPESVPSAIAAWHASTTQSGHVERLARGSRSRRAAP